MVNRNLKLLADASFKLKDYQGFKPQAFGTVLERKKPWSLQMS